MNALSQSELDARQRLVDEAPTDDFAELLRVAGLDPKKHLRFADWSGVDFSGSDLRGFDFMGAKLIGCNFKGARIEEARFDQALIDEVRPGAKLDPARTNLWAADDWERVRYAKGWRQAEKSALEHLPPGAVFQDAPFAPEMVVVPPGRFWMGSKVGEGDTDERPRHEVTIPQAFAVGRFPVTFDEWVTFHEWRVARTAGAVESKPPGEGWSRRRNPVTHVSWRDAQAYVAWLSGKTGKPYRLLSEAEWEYACRAGTETAYSFGNTITKDQAQFSEGGTHSTTKIGSFFANNFGLFDMHGNVWEWCEDRWHVSYADKPENLKRTGGAWTTGDGSLRVLRGGSSNNSPQYLRSVLRYTNNSENWINNIGFRVARTLLTL